MKIAHNKRRICGVPKEDFRFFNLKAKSRDTGVSKRYPKRKMVQKPNYVVNRSEFVTSTTTTDHVGSGQNDTESSRSESDEIQNQAQEETSANNVERELTLEFILSCYIEKPETNLDEQRSLLAIAKRFAKMPTNVWLRYFLGKKKLYDYAKHYFPSRNYVYDPEFQNIYQLELARMSEKSGKRINTRNFQPFKIYAQISEKIGRYLAAEKYRDVTAAFAVKLFESKEGPTANKDGVLGAALLKLAKPLLTGVDRDVWKKQLCLPKELMLSYPFANYDALDEESEAEAEQETEHEVRAGPGESETAAILRLKLQKLDDKIKKLSVSTNKFKTRLNGMLDGMKELLEEKEALENNLKIAEVKEACSDCSRSLAETLGTDSKGLKRMKMAAQVFQNLKDDPTNAEEIINDFNDLLKTFALEQLVNEQEQSTSTKTKKRSARAQASYPPSSGKRGEKDAGSDDEGVPRQSTSKRGKTF